MKRIVFYLAFCLPFFAQSQDRAKLLAHWGDSTLVSSIAHNNAYNEIWGLAHNGREYAVIGSTAGTHFIDVTDVSNISEVAFVAGKIQGTSIIHRDYHDYSGYLYVVADEGSSSLQIIDFSNLPTSVSVVYDEDSLIQRSHNIFIDTATAKMYSLSNRTPNQFFAMSVYDLTNPVNPTFLGAYNDYGGTIVSSVHDAYIRNDTAYLNCGSKGLQVMDFSDMANPQHLGGMLTYVGQGYNHSGWLDNTGDYYYMADENHNKPVKVVEVDDLSDIQVVTTFDAGAAHNFSIPHNLIYHNGLVYVSYYYDGLQVYDVSSPASPQRIYFYDTYPGQSRNKYEGAWGVFPFLPSGNVLVSDMQTGLYVFEMSNATNTQSVKESIDIRIFPQPFEQHLTLDLNNKLGNEDVNISILDINGRTVANLGQHTISSGENQLKLDIRADLPKGIYILNITGNKIRLSRKLVK